MNNPRNSETDSITPFADFIDSITNKLTVYGIFNALLIFGLSLKNGIGKEILSIACLVLNFLMLILIISITHKKYKSFNTNTVENAKPSDARYYGSFIALMGGSFAGLLLYSIAELPFCIPFFVLVFICFITGAIVHRIFRLIETYTTTKVSVYLFYVVCFILISIVALFYFLPLTKQMQLLVRTLKLN